MLLRERMFVVIAVYIIIYMCYRSSSEFFKVSFICKFLKTVDFLGGDLRERDCLGDLGIDGRIIIKLIFKKWDVEVWTGLS